MIFPIERTEGVSMTTGEIIVLVIVVIAGFVLGRLGVRYYLNRLLGGSLFGGNFL